MVHVAASAPAIGAVKVLHAIHSSSICPGSNQSSPDTNFRHNRWSPIAIATAPSAVVKWCVSLPDGWRQWPSAPSRKNSMRRLHCVEAHRISGHGQQGDQAAAVPRSKTRVASVGAVQQLVSGRRLAELPPLLRRHPASMCALRAGINRRRDTRPTKSLRRRLSVAIIPNRFSPQRSLACVQFVVVLCVLAWAPRVAAQATDTALLERLTWTEIGDAVHAGKTTIIIPIGGTEQSGPYVAVGKHNVRAAALSERIARQLGNALVAPVIAYVPEGNTNPPTSHMRFPGTITVPTDVFERTVESAAESFRVHGFTDIVLLGDHGGYQDSLMVVAERLNRNWASTHVRAHYIPEYYQAVGTTFAKELQARGLAADIGTHADLIDTSLMLAVDPSMVRLKQLRSAPKPDASTGVYGGDPRKSSAELGRLGIDAQVSESVQAIRRAIGQR